ncbi:PepSY-associated TM helix domain-containing protein [Massilia pseudoviolaceinigra]|uniref:PepSY-associated TM helix domain-containing protein n=1 Tax=Massilia pseudoviolaceinigra TaxID=3057165 RepID=UPI002796CD49|nr:PepSY-associated TM helix domain-containing protein [Massilia sp. CCM 9206]MDQ1924829.1 PepSY-associated TM helix domain-containing protein [Massilia sp. CCM 9206]
MADHPQADSRKAWYLLHSWAGIVLALAIYVVCASGCVALFVHELQLWQYPELQRIAAPAGGVVNVKAVLNEAKLAGLIQERATLQLPRYSNAVILRLQDDSGRMAVFDPTSGALLGIKSEGFGRALRVLHSDLLLPFPWGTFLTGFLGVTLMFLVLTGVVMHRRFYRDIFTLRTGRSWRLSWSDAHKLAGTWGIAFLGMMGFTGSVLGLAGLLLLQTAVVAHKGDSGKAYAEIGGKTERASGTPAPLGATAPMLVRDIRGEPFIPRFFTIANIGDEKATVTVEGERPDYLSTNDRKVFDREGRLLATPRGVGNGAGWRTYSALLPLHFAEFGDATLKFMYLLLGIAACLMPVSGILLWLDRHRRDNTMARAQHLMRGLAAGVTIGFPIAVAVLFLAARLAPQWMAQQGNPVLALCSAWLATVAWGLWRAEQPHVERGLLGLAGILFVLVAPVNAWVSGDAVLFAIAQPLHTSHVVDGVMLALGLILLAAYRHLKQY